MNRSPRIKFYCRSFNKELYLLSRGLYEQAGYPCVRLTDQTADGYFFTMLEDETCDIAINVDEDCFITDLDAVLELAKKAQAEGWVNIGCSDAGKGVPRKGDPTVTNPFFNVFNLHDIRRAWNAYRLIPELKQDSYKGIEPYYNFFHWMVRTFPGKTLYLDNERHTDGITTRLGFCFHTWFARQYNPGLLTHLFEGNDWKDVNHRQRIDAVIDEAYALRGLHRPSFSIVQRIGFKADEMCRWTIKVPQRIAGWPNKIRRKFGK
ncbi:MAG: hypothetical protein IKX59_11475 [Bacteroidales bacterium]|nr:hypothetical protein [Bacteroidales bacterium]